ncbi:MAG: PAS domain S-box protein [Bacteroidales bacterium]|nr:PAS domain S-box protein [Bacteroidales bacterium]
MSKESEIKGEEYYEQIVNLANVAIVKFDKDLTITDFTGNSEYIFGFKKEEVIGKNLYETIVPKIESTGRNLEALIRDVIFKTKSNEYNINENITKKGKRIWMQWYNSEIFDAEKKFAGILSIGINVTERINTEIALRESEERFKMLSDLTFEGILIHENGIISDCNLSFERQIGYSREELLGMNLFERLIPFKYHQLIQNNIKENTAHYEVEAIHKNGTIIPISIESRSAKVRNKKVRVAAIRNISDLKRTIAELDKYKNHLEEIVYNRTEEIKFQSIELKNQNEILQFERNQLRTIIDNIPDFIYIKDKECRFLNANKSLLRHLNKKKLSDITGKNDFDFYDKRYADKYFADEDHILKTGLTMTNREELSTDKTGKQIYLLTTKVPLKNSMGEIVNIVGIGRDITEKKLAETKLEVQAKNLEEINIQLKERSRKIEKLNSELKDTNKKLAFVNANLHENKEELESTLEQLKKAQAHIIQSEKMASLGILMAGIAHEINNPVNFVYAGVNSIMKDYDDIKSVMDGINSLSIKFQNNDIIKRIQELKQTHEFDVAFEAISETLKDIKLGASRISEIIAGLSRFSRIEAEDWKKANLHEELDSVLILLKNKYKNHIKILKDYNLNIPEVECYPGKLNQVLMNIISNAIDAIEDKQGIITVKTSVSSGWVSVSIRDTGKGINEKDKLKIFDPFFTTKEVGYGMGLGLAISYSIIQEHKGEIIVNSKIGKGTEFIIKIPIIQE